jgi:hypothetical protein
MTLPTLTGVYANETLEGDKLEPEEGAFSVTDATPGGLKLVVRGLPKPVTRS